MEATRRPVMERSGVKREAWVVSQGIEQGGLPAFERHASLGAWFFREYAWPALYVDEGGEA